MAFDELQKAVIEGNVDEAPRLVQQYLDEGVAAQDILDSGLIPAMDEVGATAKAIVGGAPLTQADADEIQADGYASDAPGAVALCKSLIA